MPARVWSGGQPGPNRWHRRGLRCPRGCGAGCPIAVRSRTGRWRRMRRSVGHARRTIRRDWSGRGGQPGLSHGATTRPSRRCRRDGRRAAGSCPREDPRPGYWQARMGAPWFDPDERVVQGCLRAGGHWGKCRPMPLPLTRRNHSPEVHRTSRGRRPPYWRLPQPALPARRGSTAKSQWCCVRAPWQGPSVLFPLWAGPEVVCD